MTTGLRAMKKQQTRENISQHATRLFLERGYDKVTIADVATAAQVAKMTVTNYFPRKEDLALDLGDAFVSGLAHTVAERPAGQSALAALRAAFLAAVEHKDPVIGFAPLEFARMITDSPALVARLREFHDEREAALAARLAAETEPGFLPRLAAAELGAAHRLLFDETLARVLDGQDHDVIAAALAEAGRMTFDLLEPSLGTYAVAADA